MDDFAIRQATEADELRIAEFLAAAYEDGGRYKYPERWRWQQLQNPCRPDPQLSLWLALRQGRIGGQVAHTHLPLKIGSEQVRAVNQAWAVWPSRLRKSWDCMWSPRRAARTSIS